MNKISINIDLLFKAALGILGVSALFFFLFNSTGFFYQQDEYYHFWFLNNISWWQIFTKPEGIHFFPLAQLLQWFQYKLFGLALFPRVIISLALHLTALFSVVKLLKVLNIYHRFFSPLLLIMLVGFNPTNSQAYIWMSTFSNTIPSVIFFLWSIIFFFKNEKTKIQKYFWLSLLCLFVSLLFKEYSLIAFPLFMILIYLRNQNSIRQTLKNEFFLVKTLIFSGIVYVVLRTSVQFLLGEGPHQGTITGRLNIFNIGESLNGYFQILIRTPWQIIIPYQFLKDIFIWIGLPAGIDTEGGVYTLINNFQFVLGMFSLIAFGILIYKHRVLEKKDFQFPFLFYVISVVPFTLLTFSGSVNMLEGRYYYLIAIALVTLLSYILQNLSLNRLWKKIILFLLLIIMVLNAIVLAQSFLNSMSQTSNNRIKIINKIVNTTMNINKDKKSLIIYVDGGPARYYGQTDLAYPFQAGLGNMLVVHLYDKKKFITGDYFKNTNTVNLWPINIKTANSQGVFDFKNKKFGFFYDYEVLKEYIRNNPQQTDDVFSFFWNSTKQEINDTTVTTKERLRLETKSVVFNKKMIIEHDMVILGSKKFFAVNFDKKQNIYNQNGKEIVVHLDGLESSYGGPYLHFIFKGNGGKSYTFKNPYEGYDLSFVSSIIAGGKYANIQIVSEKDSIRVDFDHVITKGEDVDITFGLNGKTIVYVPGSPMKYVLESKNISIRGNGETHYKIKLENTLRSLRSMYVNDKDRYVAIGFIDGKLTKIKTWSGYNTETLEIELPSPLKKENTLILPALVLSDLDNEKNIIFEYRID